MWCLHKRKLKIKEKVYGYSSFLPESDKILTKVVYTYFCPDCNKNVFKKYLR